jgi:hypothetical protein
MIMIIFWLRPWSCGKIMQNRGMCIHILKNILLVVLFKLVEITIYIIFGCCISYFFLKIIFCKKNNFFIKSYFIKIDEG